MPPALIDISPLFKYLVTIRLDASRLVDRVMTRDVRAMDVGQVFYTPWCDEQGMRDRRWHGVEAHEQRFRWTSAEPDAALDHAKRHRPSPSTSRTRTPRRPRGAGPAGADGRSFVLRAVADANIEDVAVLPRQARPHRWQCPWTFPGLATPAISVTRFGCPERTGSWDVWDALMHGRTGVQSGSRQACSRLRCCTYRSRLAPALRRGVMWAAAKPSFPRSDILLLTRWGCLASRVALPTRAALLARARACE